jgi:hypothetical protein
MAQPIFPARQKLRGDIRSSDLTAGKVNSPDGLHLVIESVRPDTRRAPSVYARRQCIRVSRVVAGRHSRDKTGNSAGVLSGTNNGSSC